MRANSTKKTPISTKEHLLNVAEQHFAMYGFAGTSLRGIIKEAKVNVAAVAYHFGSKEELFDAVIQRFAQPVVTVQLQMLKEVLNKSHAKTENRNENDRLLEAILLAFYTAPINLLKSKGAEGEQLSLLLGRAQTEPEPVFSLVDKHYRNCREEFIAAFRVCIPQASDEELNWHFEFMLSLIVCFLTRQVSIRQRYGGAENWSAEEAIARMVSFCQCGMTSI